MRPITFSRRYAYSVINPDHVAKVKDLSMATKFYAVWWMHPELKHITVLRKMFATHTAAASYATQFGKRYARLKVQEVTAAFVAEAERQKRAKRWWLKPFFRFRRG